MSHHHPPLMRQPRGAVGGGYGSHSDELQRADVDYEEVERVRGAGDAAGPSEHSFATTHHHHPLEDPSSSSFGGSAAAMLLRWIEICKVGLDRTMSQARKLVLAQRHPYQAAILTVLVLVIIHYRADLRQFWDCHRDEDGSVLRSLENVLETMREIGRGLYAACVVQPIQQAAMLLRQFGHNLWHARQWLKDLFFPEPMPALVPDDGGVDDGADENGSKKDEKKKKKGTAPFEGRWNDPAFLEPAFASRDEYPPGWMVYHPALGVVLQTEAEEYDLLLEKIREQEEQLRRDGIYDDDDNVRPVEGHFDGFEGQRKPEKAPASEPPEPHSAKSTANTLQEGSALKE